MGSDGRKTECISCGAVDVTARAQVSNRRFRYTPELAAIPEHSTVFICRSCGHIQKHLDDDPTPILNTLYRNYQAGNFSMAISQAVFDAHTAPLQREFVVLNHLVSRLRNCRSLLDVGCGVGTLLRAAAQYLPSCELYANDVSDHLGDELRRISGVKDFFLGTIDDIPARQFDCIVSWQSLEHMRDIRHFLARVHNLLAADGLLLIQVPDLARAPFDLAVFEHYSHFLEPTLLALLQSEGFSLVESLGSLVHNCHTVLCRKSSQSMQLLSKSNTPQMAECTVMELISWLDSMDITFNQLANDWDKELAIFGTATAAGWLQGRLQRKADFFVDEDPARQGLMFDTIPIVAPHQLPDSCLLLVPLQKSLAEDVTRRLLSGTSPIGLERIVTPTFAR